MHYLSVFILLPCSLALLQSPVDLSYGYDDETIYFPGGQRFKFTKQFAGKDSFGVWNSANDFTTAEHCGTHLDAPYHFYEEGKKVGQIPLENLLVKGIFVNAIQETNNNYNYTLPVSALTDWEAKNGPLPDRVVVLVSFGWAQRYPNRTEYLGPSDDDLRFPGLSKEAAEWLVNTKKVVGVGVDTASVDVAVTQDYPVHRILSENDIYSLENVALTPDLPPSFKLIVMPMKIMKGTGAPVRIVATF